MKLRFLYMAGPFDELEPVYQTSRTARNKGTILVVNGLFTPDDGFTKQVRRIRSNVEDSYEPEKAPSLDRFILQQDSRQARDYRSALENHFRSLLDVYADLPEHVLLVPGPYDVPVDQMRSFSDQFNFSLSDDRFERASSVSFCELSPIDVPDTDLTLLGIGGTASFDPELPDLIQYGEFHILEQTQNQKARDIFTKGSDVFVTGAGIPGTYEHLDDSETHQVYRNQQETGRLILDRFEAEPTVDELVTVTDGIPLIHGRVRSWSGCCYAVRTASESEALSVQLYRSGEHQFTFTFEDGSWTRTEAGEQREEDGVFEEDTEAAFAEDEGESDVSEEQESEPVAAGDSAAEEPAEPVSREEQEFIRSEADRVYEGESDRSETDESPEPVSPSDTDEHRSSTGTFPAGLAAVILISIALGTVLSVIGVRYVSPGSFSGSPERDRSDEKLQSVLSEMDERMKELSVSVEETADRTKTSQQDLRKLTEDVKQQESDLEKTRKKVRILRKKLQTVSEKLSWMEKQKPLLKKWNEKTQAYQKKFQELDQRIGQLRSHLKSGRTGAKAQTSVQSVASNVEQLRDQLYGRRIVFEDDYLKQAVLDAIEKENPPIRVGDVQKLRTLDASERSIASLEGLQHIPYLKKLDLADNQLTDLAPIANMDELTVLNLNNNQIQNLKPLSSLSSLRTLRLSFNEIHNLRPLTSLTGLVNLELEYNQITELGPLADLGNLKKLHLGANRITDVSPVSELTNLRVLSLWGNKIGSVTALSGLNNLKRVNLNYNMVHHLGPVAGLPKLERLYVKNNWIQNVKPLRGKHQLKEVELANNPVSSMDKKKNRQIVQALRDNGCRVSY